MTFTQQIIAEKQTATFKRVAIERTYSNGVIRYAIGTARRGGSWDIANTMKDRNQAIRAIKYTEEQNGVLVWCG